jgi:hypothetical protein
MSSTHPTTAPVTPDPVPREPSAPRITVADVMRDAFDAMDERNRRASTQQAIHAAERAFLAAYRAQRDILTFEAEDAWTDAQIALDAADAAVKGGEK